MPEDICHMIANRQAEEEMRVEPPVEEHHHQARVEDRQRRMTRKELIKIIQVKSGRRRSVMCGARWVSTSDNKVDGHADGSNSKDEQRQRPSSPHPVAKSKAFRSTAHTQTSPTAGAPPARKLKCSRRPPSGTSQIKRIEAWKRHVTRADLQRHKVVGQTKEHRHRHKKKSSWSRAS